MFKRRAKPTRNGNTRLSKARSMAPRLERQKVARRPSAARQSRFWPAARKGLWRFGAIACLTALVSAGLLAGYAALAHGGRFQVKRAQVTGVERVGRLAVLRAAGVGADSNLLALPTGKMRNRVESLPWVERAEIKRVFPDTVTIAISERRASYLAMAGGKVYYLDHNFIPFAIQAGEPLPPMPLITGAALASLKAPDPEMEGLLDAARPFLEGSAGLDENNAAGDLSEVHLDRVWGLSLVYSGLRPVIRLGRRNPAEAIRELKLILNELDKSGELARALIIDLSRQRGASVRLAGEAA